MSKLYVKDWTRETLEKSPEYQTVCYLRMNSAMHFCAFYINLCNLDNLEKLVFNQNDIKMGFGKNVPVYAVFAS